MPNSQPIARAIELAERILDEVTRRHQNWDAVRSMAISLASLADREARDTPARQDPSGEPPAPGSRSP